MFCSEIRSAQRLADSHRGKSETIQPIREHISDDIHSQCQQVAWMEKLCERIKRYLILFSGVFECLGFAGVIYGWPSLVFVLKSEAYFAELCLSMHNSSDSAASNVTDCAVQDERFALIFTITSFSTSFASIINGFLLDHCGTMASRFLCISLFAAAALMIAFSTAASAMLLFPALPLMGVAGDLLFITNIQVGNLFGRMRSTVITLINGAYDSSAVVFLLVKLFHEVGLSLRAMFLFISCLPLFLVLRTIFLMPTTYIPYPLPEGYTYGVNCATFGFCAASSNNGSTQQGAVEMGGNLDWKKEGTEGDDGNERGVSNGNHGEGGEGKEVDVREKQKKTGGVIRKVRTRAEKKTGDGKEKMEQNEIESYLGKIKGKKERGSDGRSKEIDIEELTPFTEEDAREKMDENKSDKKAGKVEAEGNDGERSKPTTESGNPQLNGPEGSAAEDEGEDYVSFWSCVFSGLFFTNLLWMSLIQLRLNLFIGTLNLMLNFLSNGDPRQVSKLTNAFAITQFCGIFCAPWNGLILDRHKGKRKQLNSTPDSAASQRLADMKSAVLSLAITVTLTVVFSISATIPVLEVQYLTFIFQMITQAFLYGGVAAFITFTYPMYHFGKLFGTSLAVAALFSLLQYPCVILVNGVLQNNPLYLNIALIVLVTIAYAHPLAVYIHCGRESPRGTQEYQRNAQE